MGTLCGLQPGTATQIHFHPLDTHWPRLVPNGRSIRFLSPPPFGPR
jgi:hypothetical protein